MDSIKNGFKSRIKALMTRNKQLDSEIENNDSEVKKTALKDEKENNNNELRQVRSQKYEYEQINEDVCYIKQCCQYLQKIGLTKSQHTFSREFLNKSPHYLSMVICENRKVAPNTLYNLIQNLNQVYDIYLNYDNKQAINRQLLQMIDKGNNLITKRILECYTFFRGYFFIFIFHQFRNLFFKFLWSKINMMKLIIIFRLLEREW